MEAWHLIAGVDRHVKINWIWSLILKNQGPWSFSLIVVAAPSDRCLLTHWSHHIDRTILIAITPWSHHIGRCVLHTTHYTILYTILYYTILYYYCILYKYFEIFLFSRYSDSQSREGTFEKINIQRSRSRLVFIAIKITLHSDQHTAIKTGLHSDQDYSS